VIAARSKREKIDAKEKKTKLVGRSLLGFLKADVDNLGLIFGQGFGQRLSVARFSAVSRMLDLFFSDYLVELVKSEFPDIYVVFAGGDDLFMVGPWWQTIRFAIELRKKLSLFCAGNSDITLSGAILTARPRLPIRKAVEIVEEDLDRAKSVKMDGRTKDSICFLGEPYSWEELDDLLKLGEKFNKALDEKDRTNFSMAFLYRLFEYHKMYRKFVHEKKMSFGRYLSLAHYDIGRNIRTEKANNEEEVLMLYDIFSVGAQDRTKLENLNVPLFYAINLNRE
jgi:CRISPR-associated protein Csm1